MPQFLLVILMLASMVLEPAVDSERFVWQQVDTQVQVREDGTLGVTETMTLRYENGEFTFAYRDIPLKRLDGISNIRVSEGGQVYQQVDDDQSTTPFTFSTKDDKGIQRVRWVYPLTKWSPAAAPTRTFTLSYDVAGAVRRYDDHDQVWWSMVFANRETVVEHATGAITLPSAVPITKMTATTPDVAPSGGLRVTPGKATIEMEQVPTDVELTLKLEFPKGVVAGDVPAWQRDADWQDAYNANTRPLVNVGLSALAAILLLGLSGWALAWYRRHRDPQSAFTGEVLQAPSSLLPGEAVRLLEETNAKIFLATLFDLANRGYVKIEERVSGWRDKQRIPFAVRMNIDEGDLQQYERELLAALFATGDEVSLNQPNRQMLATLPRIERTINQRLIDLGLIDPSARHHRRVGLKIAIVLLVVGIACFIPGAFLAARLSYWLPMISVAVLLGAVAWFVAALNIQGLTEAGADERARWNGFQRYLDQIGKHEVLPGEFGRLLPFAAAISDTRKLTRRYALTSEPLPGWYIPMIAHHSSTPNTSSGGAGGYNGLMLSDFSQNFLSVLTSAAGSSTVSGSSGGGVSSGASGGGGGGAG